MLEDFGCYPVCIEIDFNSYEGSWTHVARFRNRSGWLLVARASISVDHQEVANYPIVVGVDEYGNAIPSFMVPNILACACSHPQLCNDFPPDELEWQLEEQQTAARQMWLRDTYSEFAALDAQAHEDLAELEGDVALKLRNADIQIADLRRRRRMLDVHNEARGVFGSFIAEIETYQDSLLEWAAARRDEIRQLYQTQEKKMSRAIRPHVQIETLYAVNWIDGDRRSQLEIEHTGVYRHSVEYHRNILVSPKLSSIEEQLAALRKELPSFFIRDEIKRLKKAQKRLMAQLDATKGN